MMCYGAALMSIIGLNVLFSWLTGNNDMHLKNFSLYEVADKIRLTPAYDLLNAAIINPKDDEELALTLNGRKKKLQREDLSGQQLRWYRECDCRTIDK